MSDTPTKSSEPAKRYAYRVYKPAVPQPEHHRRGTPFTLGELQHLIGGYIETIPGPEPGTTAIINEEGKVKRLERNAAATDVMNAADSLFPGDWIAGTMIVAPNALIA